MVLAEQCRPRCLNDVVGQPEVTKKLLFLSGRGFGGRSFWFSGLSGTGKTSLAMIIAEHVVGCEDDELIESVDAVTLTPTRFDAWRRKLAGKPLFGNGRAYLINEAHGLRREMVTHLLNALEPGKLPDYATVVFTTTTAGQKSLFEDNIDTSPLMSRCQCFELESRGAQLELAFAVHLRAIAQREGMDGQPINAYIDLVRTCKFNLHAALQEIESGVMIS